MKVAITTTVAAAFFLGGVLAGHWAFGNGGPFVVKYPSGDPAAKGVLARLDPSLKPAQETRLRVVKEDLTVKFENDRRAYRATTPPRVQVTAAYTIENPTGEEVQVDFGFPILRGIYLISGMATYADVNVTIDKEYAPTTVISNSVIYGMIRQNAREAIEKGIAKDAKLAGLIAAVVRLGSATPLPLSLTQSKRRRPSGQCHLTQSERRRPSRQCHQDRPRRRSEHLRPVISRPARTCETT